MKNFTLVVFLVLFSVFGFPCDQTSIDVLTATNNGNGTYTYTVQICLGIIPSWGGTDAIAIDADVPILDSGFTSGISTTYNYCDLDLACNGANCLTANGTVMGCPPAGGNIINVIANATGSVNSGNLYYNGTNDLSPGDIYAPAGDCNDCNNPVQLCFYVTFITSDTLTSIQLTGAEQDNNDCGGGTCCPDEIDITIPFIQSSGCIPPVANFISDSPQCQGDSINFSATGTLSGVSWSWSFPGATPSSSTSQNPSGISWSSAGNYNVMQTVCLTSQPTCCSDFSQMVEILSPPFLSGTGTATTCAQCNGVADLVITGGQSPYSYFWSNGDSTQDITNLCSGNYEVTVTDNAGCSETRSFTVSSSSGPTCVISTTGSNCLSSNNFTFDYTGTNNCVMGNSPVINWSFPGGTPSSSFNDPQNEVTYASSGEYDVYLTLTDCSTPSSCTVTCTTSITVNPNPIITTNQQDASCSGCADGSATASATGGSSPYSYSWSNGQTTSTITGLLPGTYSVTVTDTNGCSSMAENILLTNILKIGDNEINLKVFPNPNEGKFKLRVQGNEKPLSVLVFNLLGEIIYQNKISANSDLNEIDISKNGKGIYYLQIAGETGNAVPIKIIFQ